VTAPLDPAAQADSFSASQERFEAVLAFLDGAEAAAVSHAELEDRLQVQSRERNLSTCSGQLILTISERRPLSRLVG